MDAREFDWDEGNKGKNWKRHKVTDQESEEVFFDPRFVAYYDEAHSGEEERYYTLSSTFARRRLFVVWTMRGKQIRVISARAATSKEIKRYKY